MRGIKYIYLLFAVTFGGVGFGILFGLVLPEYLDASIARNGDLRMAIITEYSSNMTINDVPYYRLHFRWEDKDGSWIQGWTNSAYTAWEAAQLYRTHSGEVATFPIRVQNGKAVADDYLKSEGQGFLWIFVIVFGGVGVGMGTAFVFALLKDVRNGAVLLRGQDSTGTYLGESTGMYVNNSPVYNMTFSFTDNMGVDHIVRTGSRWSRHEIDALREMGTFPVKFIGKHATVKKESIQYGKKAVHKETPAPLTNVPPAVVPSASRSLDDYVNPAANQGARTDLATYNQILREIERQRTYDDMMTVFEKYNASLDSETYARLKNDIERLREKRKLF